MTRRVSPLAGKPVPESLLVNVPRLVTAYYALAPDPALADQRVDFGTSGHRGSAFSRSFNEAHVLAICQAICLYRQRGGIAGPLFLGMDTHALSEPAFASALEVLVANDVATMVDHHRGYTPTPVISHAILRHNRSGVGSLADGIIISPSHNPPEDGGLKYNPPGGGPADVEATRWIENAANELLAANLKDVRRTPFERAVKSALVHPHDYVAPYVADLCQVVDMDAIRAARVRIGVDPLGGAAVHYWDPVVDRYGIDLRVVNRSVDPTFRFMAVDWDGKVRMDCSSPQAMAGLIAMRGAFDVAFGNDTDADRHGIVCPSSGLMAPNQFLSAALAYLCGHRPNWRSSSAIGKTVVSSGMIDRVASQFGRTLFETPVGFKWFGAGLDDGSICFAGEESAGASFLRRDGSVWTTDKDGLIMGLLAGEIVARTGQDPLRFYEASTSGLGRSFYERVDAPASGALRTRLASLSEDDFDLETLGAEPIEQKLILAPGNGAPIGGIKVTAKGGWLAIRPSGTEDIYKMYAESFLSEGDLQQILSDGQKAVGDLLESA